MPRGHFNHNGRPGKLGGSLPKDHSGFNDLFHVLKGGPGSGNKGHVGIPGHRGGSAPASSAPIEYLVLTSKKVIDHFKMKEMCKNYPKMCERLKDYTANDYEFVNEHLRSGGDPNEYKMIKSIDKMIDLAPRVPENMKVLRGIDGDDLFNKISVGSIFKDEAFVSTSIKPNKYSSYGERDVDYILEIRVPKGSKGIYVEEISGHPYEKELLLPRGSRFNVVSKESNKAVLELING